MLQARSSAHLALSTTPCEARRRDSDTTFEWWAPRKSIRAARLDPPRVRPRAVSPANPRMESAASVAEELSLSTSRVRDKKPSVDADDAVIRGFTAEQRAKNARARVERRRRPARLHVIVLWQQSRRTSRFRSMGRLGQLGQVLLQGHAVSSRSARVVHDERRHARAAIPGVGRVPGPAEVGDAVLVRPGHERPVE